MNRRDFVKMSTLLPGCSLIPALASAMTQDTPPPLRREFRGAWVATVANIDWPSKPTLSVSAQKAELLKILDNARALKINAILFQVRPACDALYASELEPWSWFLTGEQGRAPEPFYDPLEFAVTEAHKRGLELHAWINPYRATHPAQKGQTATTHITHTKPEIVKTYGVYKWLDPGDVATQEHSRAVVLDIVKRYDIDGVHIDDYFYPYKIKDASGSDVTFPDDNSFAAYKQQGGELDRDDFRRHSVDVFIETVYKSIKEIKPHVKFGISPFGIWRPKNPEQIEGYDAYANLYGDAKKWLENGWMDYCTPQLYWTIEKQPQSYVALLMWWREQNPLKRPIWPGLGTYKIMDEPKSGFTPDEIIWQVRIARGLSGCNGHIHFSEKLLRQTRIREAFAQSIYTDTAVFPPMPHLAPSKTATPAEPTNLTFTGNTLTWQAGTSGETEAYWWLVRVRQGGVWKTAGLYPVAKTSVEFSNKPEMVAITALDRFGGASGLALKTL
jgi:uncharacterized lipoprotein YddW (UPF0748 family)